MLTLKVVEHSGTVHMIDVPEGTSVMRATLGSGVPGIVGDCGGFLSCATCHGYVDPEWSCRLEPPSEEESQMIECALNVRPNSRLTCQIIMSAALDGLVVTLPQSQF